MLMKEGRICLKIAGRDAGQYCAIEKIIDDNFVIIKGPLVRNRKCNVRHIEPLADEVDLSRDVNKQLTDKFKIETEKKREKKKLKTEKLKKLITLKGGKKARKEKAVKSNTKREAKVREKAAKGKKK